MKRETITKMLNGLDERYVSEAAAFHPGRVQESPERIIPMKKKRIITLALAAALLLSLGISAYAAYNSISTPQAAEKVAREQIAVWQELGILSPELAFEGPADMIVELEEEQGSASWYGRLFPHSYDVRWYSSLEGKKYGCNLNIDTLDGKIRTATLYAVGDEGDEITGEITLEGAGGEERTYFYYDNFDDLFPGELTLDGLCTALADYWGYEGYRLADRDDWGYTKTYEALYGQVDGETRVLELPRNNSGNCFLRVYFQGDPDGAPVYFDLNQYPGYVGCDIGIRHPVG